MKSETSIFNRFLTYLVDVVQEVTALHQEDVVHVGSRGRLVQRQPSQSNIAGEVFVQHSRPCHVTGNIEIITSSQSPSQCYLSSITSFVQTSLRRLP